MKSNQVIEVVKEDAWAVAEGTHEDKLVLVRFRHNFRQVLDFEGYHLLLQITWPFFEVDPSGMPGVEDAEAMEQFEQRLLVAYEHDFHAVLTAVITTNGVRQWLFYTSDLEECGDRLTEMPQEAEPYPIELVADEDPEWLFLREEILEGCNNIEGSDFE